MNSGRRALSLRLGLALLAFSALFFFKPLEDAYTLPQGFGLTLAALGILLGLGEGPLPWTPLLWLGLGMEFWRFFCHFCSPDALTQGPWLAMELTRLALFLGAAVAMREAAARRYLAAALLAAGALGAAYALLGPLGWDPFSSGAVNLGFGRRAHGSLGNPDFLGGWLAMLLPLGLACLVKTRDRVRRWTALVCVLMALALLLTLARGAWIAAAMGCAVAWAALGWKPLPRSVWAWGLGFGALALLLVTLGPGFKVTSGRLDEAWNFHSDAWSSRIFMGAVALDLARENPVTGVGPGAFEMEYLRRQGERLWAEPKQPFRLTADAHDDWLQTAAETGFPGLIVWVLFFALALRAAWLQGGAEGAAVAGALVAFGVQGCFHFPWDIVPTAGLALVALAVAAGFGHAPDWVGPKGWPWLLILGLLASLALNLRLVAASGLLNSGTTLEADSGVGAKRLAALLLERSARLRSGDERAWSHLGTARMDSGDPKAAVPDFQNALQDLPSDPNDWTNLGLCLGQSGRLEGSAASLRQAVLLNPRSNEAWSDEAKVEYLLGRTRTALVLAREGLHQAGGSAQAWFNLGALLYNAGRKREAVPAFEAALDFNPEYPQARTLLEDCLHAR
ncbi:MAG: O-antigen ligase family protein [bacterium]